MKIFFEVMLCIWFVFFAPNSFCKEYFASSCAEAQKIVDSLPKNREKTIIQLSEGIMDCRLLTINKDNTWLSGAGVGKTILRLPDHSNEAVLVVGDAESPPRFATHNVHVSDLTIDGNKDTQEFECFHDSCETYPIRASGIAVRKCIDCRIENVEINRSRSGGIVPERNTERLHVSNSIISDSFFDGIAPFETTESVFQNIILKNNRAAGFSFDGGSRKNFLSNIFVIGGQIGIFIRDSHENVSIDFRTEKVSKYGIFIATYLDSEENYDQKRTATGNVFLEFWIDGLDITGIFIDKYSCNNIFSGNIVGVKKCIEAQAPYVNIHIQCHELIGTKGK